MSKKTYPHYWQEASDYLCEHDKVLARIIRNYPGEILYSQGNAFATLANAIVGQQISAKAAEAIWKRFRGLFPSKISYQKFLEIETKELRAIGLSKQKIEYLTNIAKYFCDNKISSKYFTKHPDRISSELLAIKGIGRWTLEMFQIFYLLDPDVFPVNDLGLHKAIRNHYSTKSKTFADKESILRLSKQWEPYRTVATWYLWRTFDTEPVAY